jgi:hypothetical protein
MPPRKMGPPKHPYEIPVAGHPVTVVPVAADPCVSRSRARRNGYRTCANVKADSSCLSGRSADGQRSHCQCCSQQKLLHAAHIPSISVRTVSQVRPSLPTTLELGSCCPLGLPVLSMQTLRKRKVAGARQNKSAQLFGRFVFTARAFPASSVSSGGIPGAAGNAGHGFG